jgi:hypothetical protein
MTEKTYKTPFRCTLLNENVIIIEEIEKIKGAPPKSIQESLVNCDHIMQCEIWKDYSKCPNDKMRNAHT